MGWYIVFSESWAIINLILESDYDIVADLNNDEILNILDIVLLVNLILYE